jgi:lipopolysaccharide transport system permease protein
MGSCHLLSAVDRLKIPTRGIDLSATDTTSRLSFQHLFLLRELVRRDFKGRYAGSLLGFLWSFAQPLWQLALFTFVFSTVMKISPGLGERTDNFAIFLFAGLLPWLAIHEGVLRSATAITENGMLVKKLSFPSEILVVAVVLAALLHEAIAALVFIVLLLQAGELSWVSLPILLIAIPIQLVMTLGLGLLLASIQVFFRDTAQILGMALQGWFYFTPIVYPISMTGRYRPFLEWNPMTKLVDLYRHAFLGGDPATLLDGLPLLTGFSIAILLLGLWTFARLKPTFVDEI